MSRSDRIQKYEEILKNPPASARGMTRWWWYGCAATPEEVVKELRFMKEAGIGGVELQILYPLSANNKDKNIENAPYFSPEFFNIIEFTADKCREMGMRFDFTLGSGWPYGGPFVTEELAMESVIPYQMDLRGPKVLTEDMTNRFVGEVVAASLGRMENSVMDPESLQDVTHHFAPRYLFNWVWGQKIQGLEIPEGNWKLCFFVVHRYRQMVGKAAPGAEGLVIDHCNRQAMDSFLENMAKPLVDRLGKGTVHSFFCDSIECDGHNWSGVLLDEFYKRRKYDLRKYIYALWGDMDEITPHIRYDYFLTMSELTIENFFDPLTEWCHKNGSRSRIQAHGTWGDILRTYGAADEPEGETFGDHRSLECNSIHRRMAVSAGHIYGKNIISNETFTWLGIPLFTETLEDMKASVDGAFLDGINQIVNHGYSLNHESVEDPGWSFYASCHIGHTNSWWNYYKYLGGYIHRVSAFLRMGRPHVEVGIYLPQADIWAENMLSDVHMAMRLEDRIGRSVADNINKAGYWFDYLNDEALTDLAVPCPGGLSIENNIYRVILLINCKRLPPETATALEAFVDSGGILIATEDIPDDSCGLMDREIRRKKVQESMDRCFKGQDRGLVAADPKDDLISILRDKIDPDVDIEKREHIGYVHRVHEGDHIYFMANISPETIKSQIFFKDRQGGCFVLPTEGEDRILPLKFRSSVSHLKNPGAEMVLELEPYQSVIVVFPHDMKSEETQTISEKFPSLFTEELTGWEFFIPGRHESSYTKNVCTWETIEGLEYYSGEGIYRTRYIYDKDYSRVIIKLDNLYHTASIYINGENAGDIWKAPYTLDITNSLVRGENIIEIRVTNTLFNRMIDPNNKPEKYPIIIDEWPYFGNVMNNILEERQPGFEKSHKPMASGLAGKIYLEIW